MAEAEPDLEEELSKRKEIKVKIPMELYLKLHQHKILHGDLLQETVQDALAGYLDDLQNGESGSEDEDKDREEP